jgi:UDP-3-O-[3-hydroxymyristoyl] glucosamine N-acyltransferase
VSDLPGDAARSAAAGIPLPPRPIEAFVERHGGELRRELRGTVRRGVPITRAAAGDLAPLIHTRYIDDAEAAALRGAFLLVTPEIAARPDMAQLPLWVHPNATWVLAEILETGDAPADEPSIGEGTKIGRGAVLLPRVRIGARVTIGPGAVIGAPGFGFATGPDGKAREIPQVGGVIIEDDVQIGALVTIASGTIGPTIIRRGAKLDAQVHVGHNCEIGENTFIAAQTGIAGSVIVGKGVMMGGQVGIADHLRVGDGAKIAAKSGVIGDVPPGATVAGYPAVDRPRWLRGLAELYKFATGRASGPPPSAPVPRSIIPETSNLGIAATIPPPKTPDPPPNVVERDPAKATR